MKLALLSILLTTAAALLSMATQRKPAAQLAALRDNQCVVCHAKLMEPLLVSAHFYEWRGSAHARAQVGCERCHGGDPAATVFKTAHQGVLNASFPTSTLAPKNAPATCQACHQEIAALFTQSRHFQQLPASGDGPSCTTCHHHMATSVIYRAPDTANLCASCHQAKGPAAQWLNVPKQAGDTIAAFSRADEVLAWSRYLVTEGRKRRLNFAPEEAEIARFEKTLRQAKLAWHGFDLKASRANADQVFLQATKLKDKLAARVK
ncbi:MAG: cytochrome c3 family protein [Acidobacteria bacterium]|nr:cytochrome c3 family protein [Acidobacteriota bacterium]MBI3426791.1 cytochrome c3 family protein [Acidobacteriota bacterium]